MNHLSQRLGMVLLVLGFSAPLAAESLQVSEEGFSIALPATFTRRDKQSTNSRTEEGIIRTTNWIYRATTGEVVVVTVSELPVRILDAEKMLASARDELLKSVQGRLESEEILPGEVTARKVMFRSDAPSPAFLISRLMVDQNRFFQVLYVCNLPERRTAPEVVQILDSFRISRQPHPAGE